MKLVEDAWGDGAAVHDMNQLHHTLGKMQSSLREWEVSIFGSVRTDLARLRRELEDVRRRSIFAGPSRRERQIMSSIAELLAREEIMEKQRSRISWLKDGDRNTGFFQAKAKERAKTNHISALRSADGVLITDQKDIEGMANDFYKELFTA